MKIGYGNLDSAETQGIDQAWRAADAALNHDSASYSGAEGDFKDGYRFAQHAGNYHFEGERGAGVDLNTRVLTVHEMWAQEANMPDSAARVLGMLAALSTQMNQAQGGNA